MLSSVASRVPVDRRPFRALRQALNEAFETEFELWCYDDGWQRISAESETGLEPAPSEITEHLDATRGSEAQPRFFTFPDGETCLVVPLPKQQRRSVAATARCSEQSPRLLLQLARLFLKEFAERNELERLRHEHQAFLRQVTNDFEELTFLRCMSRLLEISDLSFDFVAMAETMLSTLKPLLDTDTLVLIGADDSPAGSGSESLSPGCWSGLRGISHDTCRRLVQRYRDAAVVQPVVKNNFEKMSESAEFPGVNSFIMVPIVNATVTIGWLLAVNRNNDRNQHVNELTWVVSYLEFGTHEATLMASSAAILATHARNVELFREREELLVSVVRAMVSAVEAKDEYTCGHSERVALYGKRLAEELGQNAESCERLYLTGLLHDIGKIGVRDAVLRKAGPLTDDEFEEIKQHPHKGWQILHDLDPLQYVLHGVLHHHEQFDGRGYPDQLAGCGIPLEGRILAVADAYDAMTSDRPYRNGMPQERAEAILRAGAGKQWDPEMIAAFFHCMPDILHIKQTYQLRIPDQRQRATAPPSQPA